MDNKIKIFEDRKIRTAWNEEKEEWYFSVVDVCEVLSGTDNPRRYWSDLKRKLAAEGSELYEKIVQLKMTAADGKKRLTDVADTKQLLRIIQSIPSPKAEPFKMWLAEVGNIIPKIINMSMPIEQMPYLFDGIDKKEVGTIVYNLISLIKSCMENGDLENRKQQYVYSVEKFKEKHYQDILKSLKLS